ncbi:uncharacterized protein LOC110699027 isoform X5 [Chenopodium quinoa]|uniref:uncharacterized protein LOC110699027 isoform X5 n=1 Tax=Chenopodium quinoa TaxID=63459 RepID=UPI000B778DA6|nr:uncharacterized protein LOC110699027 isoform X5 [Chenopodium quinoa]
MAFKGLVPISYPSQTPSYSLKRTQRSLLKRSPLNFILVSPVEAASKDLVNNPSMLGWNYEHEPFLSGARAAAPAQGRACVYFAASITSHKTSEFELVQGVLHILQGNSSPLFAWDDNQCRFYVKTGMYVTHLSQTSLHDVLHQFLYAATCLRLVELVVERIEKEGKYFPTLRAFGSSVSSWLKRLRDIALKEDVKINDSDPRTVPTLLGMANSLSRLAFYLWAEFLLQMVREAVPKFWLDSQHSAPAAEVAVHILDQLYKKLNETCLVQGGEEDAYRMLLYLFLGSLLPYIEILDSWIFEGILDDPYNEEDLQMSELLPLQKNSTLPSRILHWIQIAEPKGSPLPTVILHECLKVYINKQVDIIGSHMLSKLLQDWRLMDELEVLRAIYLLGSGDLLQHFLLVIFNKMDKGDSWDDDFELNIILQESIRNSADAMLLTAPDSLDVSIIKPHGLDGSDHQNANAIPSTPRRGHDNISGVNGLDVLNFTYKVSWPLELIANTEAIRKYNQVMHFLLKVKRAKFVLDKVRRWIWKKKGLVTVNFKHHWLVEQKLLHFVDAFHQYVMDRVYHSAWREMCQGIAAACSLDEVIEVHEAYLLSIQRQCFVVPDKLGALIASRINTILGLALDFYSIQQTLNSGGAISAIKTRCEMEVERIEKQFDDCIAFLLRVLSFKINVGHFPHLADLVTRINYNYYYMSDNGNMMTAPGSESVKSGKAFPSRPG